MKPMEMLISTWEWLAMGMLDVFGLFILLALLVWFILSNWTGVMKPPWRDDG